jgi:hypothetical protein
MKLLTTIEDIRQYRQLGKQLNTDNFEGRVREVQDNELTELLGRPLAFDFFNSLDNDWTTQAGTFVRDSDKQFTATALDLSSWVGYALKINDEVFGVVKTAVFSVNTVITLTDDSTILPTTLTTIEFKTDAKYIKLLNGESYTKDAKTIQYNGLRPFISWKLLAIFLSDGSVKHSDTGNFSITSANFQRPSAGEKNAARSTYLGNSTREENHIIDYLNEESETFTLWDSKNKQNIENYNMIII